MNRHQHQVLCWLAGFCVTVALPGVCAADQNDLLALVRAGHRSARESIRSLSASFTIHNTIPTKQLFLKGKYWRSFDLVRIQEEQPGGGFQDSLLQKSEIRQVGRSKAGQGNRFQYAAARRPASEFLGMGNVWTDLLMDFRGARGRPCDFDQFLDSAKLPPQATRARTGGHDCIQVNWTIDEANDTEVHFTTWHDVRLNYLIRKMSVVYGKDRANRAEAEILSFAEAQPGVFFPVEGQTQIYRKGKQVNGRVTSLSNLRINTAIPKNVFQLPAIPAGTVLHDWIRGTTYTVDGDWSPAGPSRPLIRRTLPSPADGQDSAYDSPSTEEPGSWTRWLVWASLVLLGVAGGCWLYRRYWVPRVTPA